MALFERSDFLSKEGPSSLLPPEPMPRKRPQEPLPEQGPSSLLPEPDDLHRPANEPLPCDGPSSLLPEIDPPALRNARHREWVRVSPAELLPPPPPSRRPPLSWRMIAIAASAVALVCASLWVAPRLMAESSEELLSAAATSIDNARYDVATIHLKNLLQREPSHARARYLLGMTYTSMGSLPAAESELRMAIDFGMDREKAIPALGRVLLLQGHFDKLLEDIRPTQETDPLAVRIRTLRGLAYLGNGRTVEANVLFQQALEIRPNLPEALLGAARVALFEKRLQDADRRIEQALRVDPRNLDGLLLKADLHLVNDRIDDAKSVLRQIVGIYPDNAKAHLSLARLALHANQLEVAAPHVEAARKSLPDAPQPNYLYALIQFQQGHLAQAREAIVRALKATPAHVPSLILAGAIAYAEANYSDAEVLLLRGLSREPAHVGGRKLYAATLLKRNRSSAALKVLLPTLPLAPNDHDLLTLLGQGYMQTGDHATAAGYLEKAAALRPDDAKAHAALGISHLAAGRIDPALTAVEAGLRADPRGSELDALMVVVHMQRGNDAAAERAWGVLNSKQPDAPVTHQLKAAVLAARKDLAGARKALATALLLDPTFVPAAMGLAKLDLDENDPINARARLEKILRADPKNVEALVALAEIGERIKASDQEIRDWLLAAQKIDPASPRAAALLARDYLERNDPKQAAAVARLAHKHNPEHAELLDVLAVAHTASGDMNAALDAYVQLASLRPKSADVLYRLGRMQAATGSRVAAASTYRKVLQLQPNHEGALAAMAQTHVQAGRHADALAIARQLKSSASTSPAAWMIEGDVASAENRAEAAVASYEKAQNAEPTSAGMLRMFTALEQSGRMQEADERLSRWIENHPHDLNTRLFYGDVLMRRQDFARAKEVYLGVVRRRPDHALAHNSLAWAMIHTRDGRARSHAETAYKLNPEEPAVLDTLGLLLVREGEITRGIELLQRAVARAPSAIEPRLHLAQAWLSSGNATRARVELEQALESNPDAEVTHAIRQQLASIPY